MIKAPNTIGCTRSRIRLTLLISASLLGFASHASAVAPISDDSELFVTANVSASENDNLFLSHANATSAIVYDIAPGLSYEFGKNNALTSGQLAYWEDFQIFSKFGSRLNNQLANVVFWTKYDDAKNKLNVDASYHQADQAQVGIQNLSFLVNRDLYHVDALGEVSVTEKTSLGAGVAYDDTNYQTAGYTDYRYTEVPVNYYFKVEPKLDLSAGFRYRDNTLGAGGIDSTDYFYNVGLRGELTPLLTGQFNVGYQEEKLVNRTKQDSLGLDSNFNYACDPKTSLTLGLISDYGYAAVGSAFRNSGINLGVTSALNDQWSLRGQVGYNRYAYITTAQKDNYYSGQLGISYLVNVHVTVGATYTYGQDNSNITLDSFKNNIFSVSGSLHF